MKDADDDVVLWVLRMLVVVTATVAAQNLAAGPDERRKLTEVPPSFTERVLTGQTDCGRLQQSDAEECRLREGQHVTFRHLLRSMAAHLGPRCTPDCYHSAVL